MSFAQRSTKKQVFFSNESYWWKTTCAYESLQMCFHISSGQFLQRQQESALCPIRHRCAITGDCLTHTTVMISTWRRTDGSESSWLPSSWARCKLIGPFSCLKTFLGHGSLLPLSQGEAFTLASISYLAILVKYILAKKKKMLDSGVEQLWRPLPPLVLLFLLFSYLWSLFLSNIYTVLWSQKN